MPFPELLECMAQIKWARAHISLRRAATNRAGWIGLGKRSKVWPSALALWSKSEVAACPENNSIRASGQARWIRIAVCTPSRSGMITSLITISGQISPASSIASAPLSAHTVSNPARERMSLKLCAINSSSSTTKMRCFLDESSLRMDESPGVPGTGIFPENRCNSVNVIRFRPFQFSCSYTLVFLGVIRRAQR